jgi:hypothetical protein
MASSGAATFDDCGVRFAYPRGWQVEVTEEDEVITVSVHSPSEPAFALVTLDPRRLDADEVADNALEVMREEYPDLDATPAQGQVAGYPSTGHDAEFFALDVTNACAIRCFRTPRRTVLLFSQWSDIAGDDAADVLDTLMSSFAETDAHLAAVVDADADAADTDADDDATADDDA